MTINWQAVLASMTPENVRAFVEAARNVIQACMVELEKVSAIQTPKPTDYTTAELNASAPPGGWITDTELRNTVQKMNEAIAAERWVDGALFVIKAIAVLGVGA